MDQQTPPLLTSPHCHHQQLNQPHAMHHQRSLMVTPITSKNKEKTVLSTSMPIQEPTTTNILSSCSCSSTWIRKRWYGEQNSWQHTLPQVEEYTLEQSCQDANSKPELSLYSLLALDKENSLRVPIGLVCLLYTNSTWSVHYVPAPPCDFVTRDRDRDVTALV